MEAPAQPDTRTTGTSVPRRVGYSRLTIDPPNINGAAYVDEGDTNRVDFFSCLCGL